MRKIFFLLFILSGTAVFSQKDRTKTIEDLERSIAEQTARVDSGRKSIDSLILRQAKSNDSENTARYMEQNTRNMVSLMQERERKQKQGMWLRIGAGLLFLAVGIYGVMRKRKPKTGDSGLKF